VVADEANPGGRSDRGSGAVWLDPFLVALRSDVLALEPL